MWNLHHRNEQSHQEFSIDVLHPVRFFRDDVDDHLGYSALALARDFPHIPPEAEFKPLNRKDKTFQLALPPQRVTISLVR
jgi:hypothetical protein